VELVIATHRRIRQTGAPRLAGAPYPTAWLAFKVEILVNPQQPRTDRARLIKQGLRWLRIAADGATSGAIDARLFETDRLPVRTQPVGVVDSDAGHDGDIRVPDIHGIQPAAETDFEDGDLHLVLTKQLDDSERAEFEIGQRCLATRCLDALEGRAQHGIAHRFRRNVHTFVVVNEMRGGVGTHTVAGSMQGMLEHRHRRTLAVRAGNRNDRERWLRQPKTVTHHLGARESQFDLAWMERLQPREPLLERLVFQCRVQAAGAADTDGRFIRMASIEAIFGRISRRSMITSTAP
jgi:hypothetical protein